MLMNEIFGRDMDCLDRSKIWSIFAVNSSILSTLIRKRFNRKKLQSHSFKKLHGIGLKKILID